jgi:hypothetical protein
MLSYNKKGGYMDKHVKTSRINFNIPANIHICLKKCAIDQGMSVTELAT